jgi:hypothetical protein
MKYPIHNHGQKLPDEGKAIARVKALSAIAV